MNKPRIGHYNAPKDVILVAAEQMDIFYDRLNGEQEVIGLMAHDQRLGPIAVLFTPQGAEEAGRNLHSMATLELQRLRSAFEQRRTGDDRT